MTSLNFEDFYKVPEIKFNISKLRNDLDAILAVSYTHLTLPTNREV